MRITVNVNQEALRELLEITKSRKKSQAVSRALEAFLKQKRIEALLSMRGKLKIENHHARMKKEELKQLEKLARSG